LITPPKYSIVISPIGDVDHLQLNQVQMAVHELFGYETEIIHLISDIDFAFDPVRDQYYSKSILERLADLAPIHTIKLLAICDVDLFIPILTHVYGEAQLGGKTCIISTFRLKQALHSINPQKKIHQRIVKEAIHELGHTFNLRHCRNDTCAMHYCRTITDVDKKSARFCRYCRILLDDEKKRLEA
jgi:archaemetzincin